MLGVPFTATAKMGSAFGLTDAAAMGTAPDEHDGDGCHGGQDPGQVARSNPVPPGPRLARTAHGHGVRVDESVVGCRWNNDRTATPEF